MGNNYKAIFYGALGKNSPEITVGGGETGNLKTIHLLRKNNIHVIKIYKPYPAKKSMFGNMKYIFKMLLIILTLILTLISNPTVKTIHISAYYFHLIYHEYFLVLVSRFFRKRCIYELRGGGVVNAYNESSFIYRYFFKAVVKNATILLCQGNRYINFLKQITKRVILYYPNYILDETIPDNVNFNRHKSKCVQLIYFGRIVKSKNPSFIFSIGKELKSKKIDFNIEIIGSCDPPFSKQLQQEIKDLKLEKCIKLTEPLTKNLLIRKLATKHFFLFPSKEKREGHSNALTESMAMGVVPICSDIGFNSEIIGCEDLIVYDYIAKNYANKVLEIWQKGEWKYFSEKVLQRVKENYTEKFVENTIRKAYDIKIA